MLSRTLSICALLWAGLLPAAELVLDFNRFPAGEPPPGYASAMTGIGQPGEWKILLDELPALLPPLTPGATSNYKTAVVAQLSTDPTDERFPLLIYEGDTFADFKLTTRFKLVAGQKERMAGIAFRLVDQNNYYYIRASGLGNNLSFFKVVNGTRSPAISKPVEVPSGTWHTLSIECQGSTIRGLLNGQEIIPPLDDKSFLSGKIAFWTKSDSVSYFTGTKIEYTPRETLAEVLVRKGMAKYERLLGLAIVAVPSPEEGPVVVASTIAGDIGRPAWPEEKGVLEKGEIYQVREKRLLTVSMPLRDRNGEPMAAVRVMLKPFPGQTEKNALARASIVVKWLEAQISPTAKLLR